jgi:hypothetical protein
MSELHRKSNILRVLPVSSMIDFEEYVKRVQDALGVKNVLGMNCVDVIDEGLWRIS